MPVANFSLEGKVAIVTGGSRGIGRSIAIGLAEHGADVAIAARKPEALAETVAAIQATGRRAIAVPTNVRRIEELRALVDQTLAQLGRLDILVNNAGTNPFYGRIEDMDERAFDAIMDTNVKAVHFLSNFAREAMLQQGGGAIVNVGSVGGFAASDVIGGYSVSKAALIMLTQVQAKTWGRNGIRVNCIAPGLVHARSGTIRSSDSEWASIRQLYASMIVCAQRHVMIQSPYFIWTRRSRRRCDRRRSPAST